RQLVLQDHKVFYLNLESLHSTSLFLTSSQEHLSTQILYYIKANQAQLEEKIRSLKVTDPYFQVDYFNLPANAKEMEDLTQENVDTLVAALMDMEVYDYILIDLDSSLNNRNKAALRQSDLIFWLL